MESVTKWGGQRPGAGRSLKEEKAENRTLRVTDRLWEAARIAAKREHVGSPNSCRERLTKKTLLKTKLVLFQLICIRKDPVSLCDLTIHRETVFYQRGTSPANASANSAPPLKLFDPFLLFPHHITPTIFRASSTLSTTATCPRQDA